MKILSTLNWHNSYNICLHTTIYSSLKVFFFLSSVNVFRKSEKIFINKETALSIVFLQVACEAYKESRHFSCPALAYPTNMGVTNRKVESAAEEEVEEEE